MTSLLTEHTFERRQNKHQAVSKTQNLNRKLYKTAGFSKRERKKAYLSNILHTGQVQECRHNHLRESLRCVHTKSGKKNCVAWSRNYQCLIKLIFALLAQRWQEGGRGLSPRYQTMLIPAASLWKVQIRQRAKSHRVWVHNILQKCAQLRECHPTLSNDIPTAATLPEFTKRTLNQT